MRRTIFIFLALIAASPLIGQDGQKAIPLNLGLYAPYFTQAGLKAGTEIGLLHQASGSLYLSPQAGAFIKPSNHLGLLLNADLGYRLRKKEGRFYGAGAIGLGWLNRIARRDASYNLATGEIASVNRERTGWFLPSLNLEIGSVATEKPGWYLKFTGGQMFSTSLESRTFFAAELGLKFNLAMTKRVEK